MYQSSADPSGDILETVFDHDFSIWSFSWVPVVEYCSVYYVGGRRWTSFKTGTELTFFHCEVLVNGRSGLVREDKQGLGKVVEHDMQKVVGLRVGSAFVPDVDIYLRFGLSDLYR